MREMQASEVDVRVAYFHDASDDHLRMMGVDRSLLPSRDVWCQSMQEDCTRPIRQREIYALVWELDALVVGFSAVDRIRFGEQAFMHLHIIRPSLRQEGLGTRFVRKSAATYFRELELRRLYCEPNALNAAPNRTLQRAGFRYQFSHETIPGPLNFPQVVTRWLLEPGDLDVENL